METLVPMLIPMSIWSSIVDFGSTIMQPLYWAVSGLLVLFHSLWSPLLGVNNGWTWTLSIVCLTVVIRVILIPLFVRQIRSSRNMQLLQPKVRELQKKYGHDREKLGQETMKLYRENNANPLASCLPLLLQMPIFLALFRVLDGASREIARGKWLRDDPSLLTSLHDSTIFGAKISDKFLPLSNGFGAVQVLTIILIVLMTVTMFITQLQLMRKNMPIDALTGPMAQQQKIMLYLFPIIFAVGGVNFPVGVLIYWLTTNLWTMGQQFYVIRRNPAPGTPAYDAWEARRKAHGKSTVPTAPTGSGSAGTNGSINGNSRNGRNGQGAHPNGSSGSNGDGAHAPGTDDGRPRVVRQQPRKQSRSKRRT